MRMILAFVSLEFDNVTKVPFLGGFVLVVVVGDDNDPRKL